MDGQNNVIITRKKAKQYIMVIRINDYANETINYIQHKDIVYWVDHSLVCLMDVKEDDFIISK